MSFGSGGFIEILMLTGGQLQSQMGLSPIMKTNLSMCIALIVCVSNKSQNIFNAMFFLMNKTMDIDFLFLYNISQYH